MLSVLLCLLCQLLIDTSYSSDIQAYSTLDDIIAIQNQGVCLVLFPADGCDGTSSDAWFNDQRNREENKSKVVNNIRESVIFKTLNRAYRSELAVRLGWIQLSLFVELLGKESSLSDSALLFPKGRIDRSCLLSPVHVKPEYQLLHLEERHHYGYHGENDLIHTVNSACNTFRQPDGTLNRQGFQKQRLLSNLFTVSSSTVKTNGSAACEKVPMPTSWNEFYKNLLSRSKPVIITGATKDWKGHTKWTNQYLRDTFGNRDVHIKLTPGGEFEGVDNLNNWNNPKFAIPDSVKRQLPFPDLVVVRPATRNMNFSDFLDLVNMVSNKSLTNVSAYLEYSSVPQYFPELKEDMKEMPFLDGRLHLKHINMWLSDGDTLGKLHFDPFDNFLCQISGTKQVALYEPYHNDRLYEAHIPEAQLSMSSSGYQFNKRTLMESTSMVMSPVDIKQPNYQRFPKFAQAQPISCTINEGETLFMPAFWWHEVQSYPSQKTSRNLAINFWYEPFFTKEFPCPDCKFDINEKYFNLL